MSVLILKVKVIIFLLFIQGYNDYKKSPQTMSMTPWWRQNFSGVMRYKK